MTTITSGNTNIVVDEEGFLEEGSFWNEEVARVLAEHEGISDLTSDKLKIINSMREHYAKHQNFPILRNVCRKAGDISRDCVAREFVDPMKAWKIAGLPKPPNIFFTSFDDKKFIPNPFY